MADFLGTQWRWDRMILVLVAMNLLFVVVAEIAVRADDRVQRGIAFTANPTYESELRTVRDGIVQGRPNGHYEKFQLNSSGFRGPEIALEPREDCERLMVIGGSEMFGLFETPGHDFSAALQSRLSERGCFEVINTAMAGMSLDAALAYWNLRLKQFKPHRVLIYATPAPQITDAYPAVAPTAAAVELPPSPFRLRFIDWLRQYIHLPEVIEDWRTRRKFALELAQHPPNWVIDTVPQAGLASFSVKMRKLIDAVQSSGATVVLMTHAERGTLRTLPARGHDIAFYQENYPQIAPHVQLEFNTLVNDWVRQTAATNRLLVIDIDHVLTGCEACFADPVHFSDLGASRAANAAAEALASTRLVLDQQRR